MSIAGREGMTELQRKLLVADLRGRPAHGPVKVVHEAAEFEPVVLGDLVFPSAEKK